MHPSRHAETHPNKLAYVMAATGEGVTYADLDARSNQVAQMLRGLGLKTGDCIALFMENVREYFELAWGAQRSGLYFACISSKLTAEEVAYILRDSGAQVLFASASLGHAAAAALALAPGVTGYAIGGAIPGCADFAAALAAAPAKPVADETSGADMLYSSGTTGRPKGVKIPLSGAPIDAPNPLVTIVSAFYGVSAESIYLSPAPLYHAAPLRWCMSLHKLGGTTIIMDKFDPEAYLELVERHGVTASQVVPTMFVRLLKLPEAVRARYDVSSLKSIIHAAAPCPIPIKQQMIEWWGPKIFEYYAGTEGNGFCTITSQEWLAHKGSVGKSILGVLKICNDDGVEVPAGQSGTVFFADGPKFEYHNDPTRTADSRHPKQAEWSTLGDVGYVDHDGYLYLTDRKAFMIISGGVNIYPQEVENLLVTHPRVADAAVFGIPNEDFGEEVKAAIQPLHWADAGPELEAELLAFCREHLSTIKCPRSIDFLEELPRHPTGKLYKRLLRDKYWTGRDSTIV
ncbi:MAG: AMP-binding protein [Caulobacterales bacterium]